MTSFWHAALVAVAQVIEANSGLTLQQAIDEGLRKEPALRAARLEIDAARGERQQAAQRPNPMVSIGQREQLGGMDRQTSIEVDLPLDLFRRRARLETADRTIEVTAASIHDQERLLAAAIRDRYGEALVAQRRLDIMDALLGANRTTVDLLRRRVAEGAVPPLDHDIALVELRRLEGERELAAGRFATALNDLKQLLGRPPSAGLTLQTPLAVVVQEWGSVAVPASTAARADVRQAAAEVAVARARTREAALERKPEVGVFASYMRMREGFPQLGVGASGQLEPIEGVFHNLAGGIRVSIPLFNRGQGLIAAAQAREHAASIRLSARELAATTEVVTATARLEAARRAASAYSDEARALAQRNLDVIRETYTLGRATLFDVLNEQRRFLDFEAAFTDTLAELFSAHAALRRATGELK